MVKILENIFSRIKKILRQNFGIKCWGLKVYQVCSNDGHRLTFDFYGTVKFVPLCVCMGKILKIQCLKMYLKLMAETKNI